MISPIHPDLQGIAAERFFALGQELMRRQRSNQCDRLTELSDREAAWADHYAGMNGDRERYKACARVLIDLAKARWTVAEDRFGIELQSPDARPRDALSQQEIEQGKRRVLIITTAIGPANSSPPRSGSSSPKWNSLPNLPRPNPSVS